MGKHVKTKDAISQLGIRFSIESGHTDHVARLAMGIFEGFAPGCGLFSDDGKLLRTAARLHDIGYASNPENHVIEGARILQDNRLPRFSSQDWLSVIGIVLLHHRNWKNALDEESFPPVGAKQLARIKSLAAMLRIADGLDHGHIQDVRILDCRPGRKIDRIKVNCRGYAGSVAWAEGKADLWKEVFGHPLRIEGSLNLQKRLYQGVVHKSDSAATAARRILFYQCNLMRDNLPGMIHAQDPRCLHDFRLALRRFRSALRMFKPIIDNVTRKEIDLGLHTLSDRLGPVRDTDVALELYRSLVEDHESEIGSVLEDEVRRAWLSLEGLAESDVFQRTITAINRLLRVELPGIERNGETEPFAAFASARLEPLLYRIRATDISGIRERTPEEIHQVRKRCRKGRYFAEFSVPVLDRQARTVALQLKRIASALGSVRDQRRLAQRFKAEQLCRLLAKQEKQAWNKFNRAWNFFSEQQRSGSR